MNSLTLFDTYLAQWELLLKKKDIPQLQDVRNALAPAEAPHIKQEKWNYSSFPELLRTLPRPVLVDQPKDLSYGNTDAHVVLLNGCLVRTSLPQGVSLERKKTPDLHTVSDVVDGIRMLGEQYILNVQKSTNEPLGTLIIEQHYDTKGLAGLFLPTFNIQIHHGAEIAIVVRHYDHGGQGHVSLPQYLIHLGEEATATWSEVCLDSMKSVDMLARYHVSQGTGSRWQQYHYLLSQSKIRMEIDVTQHGADAHTLLQGLSMAHGQAHHEYLPHVQHLGQGGWSSQKYRYALGGESKGVYQGTISIPPHVENVEGHQMTKGILLSTDARLDAKPRLKIETDNVQCSHGVSIGHVDPDALFFLRSRGLSEMTAKNLLVRGFVEEMLGYISEDHMKDTLFSRVESLYPVD